MHIMLIVAAIAAATTQQNTPAMSTTATNSSTIPVEINGQNMPQQYSMPMDYKSWEKMSPELKRIYAETTVDALKWSYLFNDCSPLTAEEIIKGIDAGDQTGPIMMAVAETAYATCQD